MKSASIVDETTFAGESFLIVASPPTWSGWTWVTKIVTRSRGRILTRSMYFRTVPPRRPGPGRVRQGEVPRDPEGVLPLPDNLRPQAGPARDGGLRAPPPGGGRVRDAGVPDGGRAQRSLR